MKWPLWVTVAASTALGLAAVAHAWIAGCRRARRPPTLPRLSRAVWAVAIAGWLVAELPWTGWLKEQVKSFKIPSSSMEPTLLVGDRIWAKRQPSFERGDIIVFRPPDRPEEDYIKRIVGLPGETLFVRHKRVYINGHLLADTVQVHRDPEIQPVRDDVGPIHVPAGCYFVMGDNRDNSRDSRYFGFVPAGNIYGRAYKRFWPMGRTGPLN
jgi:signal peptidase I